MTVPPAGNKQPKRQIRCGKGVLLSCLSRLIVEGQRIEPRFAATGQLPDPVTISRAIIRETLSFHGTQQKF